MLTVSFQILITMLLTAGVFEPRPTETIMTVVAPFHGASVDTLDSAIAQPLIRQISRAAGVTRIESTCRDGRCQVVVRFSAKIDPDVAMRDVQAAINAAMGFLPADCSPPQIERGDADALPFLWITTRSDRLPLDAISEYAQQHLANHLAQIAHVRKVQVMGERISLIRLDLEKLKAVRLTAGEVNRAINEALGKADPARVPLLSDASSLQDIAVSVRNGTTVRVKDVARVETTVRGNGFATVGGKPAMVLGLSIWESVEATVAAVGKEVDQIRQTMPAGMQLDIPLNLARDHGLLIEVNVPQETSPLRLRQLTDKIAGTIHEMDAKAVCIAVTRDDHGVMVLTGAGEHPLTITDLRRRLATIPDVTTRICEVGAGAGQPFPVRLALVGPDVAVLQQWADAAKAQISADGAADYASVFPGPATPQFDFEMDPARLSLLGISMTNVEQELACVIPPAASIRLDADHTAEIRYGDRPKSAEELGDMTIRSTTGDLVPLSAVARITSVAKPTARYRFGWEPAVRMTAGATPGATDAAATARCIQAANAQRDKLKLSTDYRVVDLNAPGN